MSRVAVMRALEWSAEVIVMALAVTYVMSGADPVLFAWELFALAYLLTGAVRQWRRAGAVQAVASARRVPVAGAWLLPLLSSAVGLVCAVVALQARANAVYDLSELYVAAAACLGVVISWLLLHVGVADVYEREYARDPSALSFPGSAEPERIDFLCLSLTIGTSFANSSATVRSRRVRRVITAHAIVSFFYNALVVAVAFQVLQQVLGG